MASGGVWVSLRPGLFLPPQADDPVAQLGGIFEFQELGGLAHLLLQLGDGLLPLSLGSFASH